MIEHMFQEVKMNRDKQFEEMERTLKTLFIWSTFEDGRGLSPEKVAKLCRKALGKEERDEAKDIEA